MATTMRATICAVALALVAIASGATNALRIDVAENRNSVRAVCYSDVDVRERAHMRARCVFG